MDLYQEEILDHYRHPHHHGTLPDADIVRTERNSSCGDELTFYLKFANEKIADISFEGQGCAISQAAASMLTDELVGKSKKDIAKLQKDDVLKLLGTVSLTPTRLQCALLPLQAVTNAVVRPKREL